MTAPIHAALPDQPASTPRVLFEGPYRVAFARDADEVRRAQRLRYEVFNLELAEGLAEAHAEGLDRDPFDACCDHLLVVDARDDTLVGTYRMQVAARAEALYCDQEYDLRGLPPEVHAAGVELGRACIAKGHRNGLALFALWRGLAAYGVWAGTRYFFGCSSLSTQDEGLGWRTHDLLRERGHLLPGVSVTPRPGFACARDASEAFTRGGASAPELPKLFGTYLRYGARVCSPPAIDRAFGTIDFLVLLDCQALAPRMRRLFFEGLEPELPACQA